MKPTGQLNELKESGSLNRTADGWTAEPNDVVNALARDGFEECKREEARDLVFIDIDGARPGMSVRPRARRSRCPMW